MNKKTLFWNEDTQYDFMRDDESFHGTLAVQGARAIESNLEKLTKLAEREQCRVMNTADWHTMESKEISLTPDFKTTYPPHCMAYTKGAAYVSATEPKNPLKIYWQQPTIDEQEILSERNIVLYKDDFDVFKGSQHTDKILELLNPERVIVYGVATNVCVHFAVVGLLKRGKEVYVVEDAIKELPEELAAESAKDVFKRWNYKGNKATLIKTEDVSKYII